MQTTVEETSNQFIHRGLACGNINAIKKIKLMTYTDRTITPEVIPSATGYEHSAASSIMRGTVPQKSTTWEIPEAKKIGCERGMISSHASDRTV